MDRVQTYDTGSGPTGVAPATDTRVDIVPTARRVSWGAVFGGVVLALAVNILLSLLGIGIGLTTVDPVQPGGSPAASSLGIGAAIWWVVSMLVAMFVGGYTAARLAGVVQSGDGLLHGLITWAFVLLLTFYLLTSAIGGMVGGAFNTLTSGLQSAAGAVPEATQAAQNSGITGGQIGRQVDQLISQVAPDATPEQVQQARQQLTDLAPQLLQGGEQAQQARQQASQILAQLAGQTPEQIQAQVDQALQQAETQARQTAETAANAASHAAIWGFVALALGAAAAAFGGKTGTRQAHAARSTTAGVGR